MTKFNWVDCDSQVKMTKVSENEADPVFVDANGKFYFSDEVWCDLCGPFEDEESCRQAYAVKWLFQNGIR